jgi:putative transposase
MLNSEMAARLRTTPAAAQATPAPTPAKRRNGRSKKTASGDPGELVIDTKSDRASTFEPQAIPKQQLRPVGFDEKVLVLLLINHRA